MAISSEDLPRPSRWSAAVRAANVDAPLNPNPLLNGRSDVMSTVKGVSVKSLKALVTVGNSISSPLKVIVLVQSREAATSTFTPSLTVNPHPNECIFAGSSWAMILNRPEMFPGANALATLRIKSCLAFVSRVRGESVKTTVREDRDQAVNTIPRNATASSLAMKATTSATSIGFVRFETAFSTCA